MADRHNFGPGLRTHFLRNHQESGFTVQLFLEKKKDFMYFILFASFGEEN
jgi:hypothetical protein